MPRKKSEAEVERGLLAVADASGNTRQAARALKRDGVSISHTTLDKWVQDTHAQRYAEIRREQLPKIRKQMREQHIDMATRNIEAERKALERAVETMDELKANELHKAARDFAVGGGIHTDKATTPEEQVALATTKKMPEIIRSLKQRIEVLDGEAVEEDAPALEEGEDAA